MAVEVGKRYYFIVHAYHHYLAEVVEITGKQEAWVKNVLKIHRCSRGWTEFFRDGMQSDTEYMHFPSGSITWMAAFDWAHSYPEAPNATSRRQ